MLYAMTGIDAADAAPRRAEARAAHLQRLQALQAEGRLLLAGPFPRIDAPDLSAGVSGTLVVAEFESLSDAQAWLQADPYVAAGVFAHTELRPFYKVLPA